MKPTLKKTNGSWICESLYHIGIGNNPITAYFDWLYWNNFSKNSAP